ncbi:MAG: aminotransferase class IV [Planctomycetota bacterium]
MGTLVNINGTMFPPEEAVISVFDRGFLYGDSVYETVRTYQGRLFLMERHLARLGRSAERLWLAVPGGLERVGAEALRTLEAVGNPESCLRIVITRGARPGLVQLDIESAGESTLVLIARPFSGYAPEVHRDGVDVALVGVLRTGRQSLDPKVKSGNYLNNIIALHEARSQGAFECLMPNREGDLTEGSTSNVFLVQGGVVRTPSLESGLLDGITRSFVLELAKEAGYPVREERLGSDDLFGADEVFLTSSLKEVMPVRSLNGEKVGDGRPGPVTLDLLRRYRLNTAKN